MVVKLFRTEFSASFKKFVPVMVLIGVATILGFISVYRVVNDTEGFINSGSASIVAGFLFFAIIMIVYAVGIMIVVSSVNLLYKNIYKVNAYRLFTLPVKASDLFISRLAIVVFWNLVCGLLAALGVTLVLLFSSAISGAFSSIVYDLRIIIEALFAQLPYEGFLSFFLWAVNAFVELLGTFAALLFAGAIANSSAIRKHRGAVTCAIFLALLIVESIITNITGFYLDSSIFASNLTGSSNAIIPASHIFAVTIYNLVVLAGLSYGTIWFWDHKLEVIN